MRYLSICVLILSFCHFFPGMKKKSKRGTANIENLYIGQSRKNMRGRVEYHIREATKKGRPKQAIQRKMKQVIRGKLHY